LKILCQPPASVVSRKYIYMQTNRGCHSRARVRRARGIPDFVAMRSHTDRDSARARLSRLLSCASRRLVSLRLRSELRLTGSASLRLVASPATKRERGRRAAMTNWEPSSKSMISSTDFKLAKLANHAHVVEPNSMDRCVENSDAGL